MKKLVSFACLVLAIGLLAVFWPPMRVLALSAAGRRHICSLEQAFESDRNWKHQIALKDEILHASHKIRSDGIYEQWQTPHGTFWIPAESRYVLPFNLAEQQRKIYGTGEQPPHAGDVVIDCGANIGVTVHEWLKDGAEKIIAVEPAPENLECLRRNFPAEIASGRVILYPKGVWDRDDTLTLEIDPGNSAADTFLLPLHGAKPVQRIPVTTLDHLVDELQLTRVDFIKMDIEGAEQRALAGARKTLAKWHPRLSIAGYHVASDTERIPALVREAWPEYKMRCGPCAEFERRIRPDVLYFF